MTRPDGRAEINLTVDDNPGGVAKCDFCSAFAAVWNYPCASFDLPLWDSGSVADWAACADCSALIEAGDDQSLFKRAVETFYPTSAASQMSVGDLLSVSCFIRDMHEAFRAHRTGVREAVS